MTARTRRLAEARAAVATVAALGRGARFAQRLRGERGPVFADLAAVPDWLGRDLAEQQRIAAAAALLAARSALDVEISGPRLAAIAQVSGEDVLDAVLAAPSSAADAAPVPRPDQLIEAGRAILEIALPPLFAQRYSRAEGDIAARDLVARAESALA